MLRVAHRLGSFAALLGLFSSGGCEAPDARRHRLQSLSPVERSDAIVATAQSRDFEAVAALVDRLDDDDRAVRLYAILALRELCGEDFGYRYYAPSADRASAIEAWRAALREGRFGSPGETPGREANKGP